MSDAPALGILDRIDSTNAEALRRIASGVRGPAAILALSQTAGRGRRGKAWDSPTGNLFLTLIEPEPVELAALPFRAGLAVHAALRPLVPAGVALQLKWPNDVLADEAKLAGILIERGEGALAVGIGVNLVEHPSDTPYPATDLAALRAMSALPLGADGNAVRPAKPGEGARGAGLPSEGSRISKAGSREPPQSASRPAPPEGERTRTELAAPESVAHTILAAWHDLANIPTAELHRVWLSHAWRLGERLRVDLGSDIREGAFTGLDASGALLLDTHDGQVVIVAGSVLR